LLHPLPAAAGYNVCIFAYGQTGSGKTHTMSGTNVENMAGRGINYRALDDLFAIRDARIGEVGGVYVGGGGGTAGGRPLDRSWLGWPLLQVADNAEVLDEVSWSSEQHAAGGCAPC
jgi:hypothetical protein